MTDARSQLLRRALQANAGFSVITGAMLLVAPSRLWDHLGLERGWILPALGLGLIGFAGLLVLLARQDRVDLRAAGVVCLADGLWVTGSGLLVLWDPLGMTTVGRWLVLGVAGAVLLFALAQGWGVHRVRSGP